MNKILNYRSKGTTFFLYLQLFGIIGNYLPTKTPIVKHPKLCKDEPYHR